MRDYQRKVQDTLNEYLAALEKRDKRVLRLLSVKWGEVANSIENEINRIGLTEISSISANQLYLLTKYQDFLIYSRKKAEAYATEAAGIIEGAQGIGCDLGYQYSKEILATLGAKIPERAVEEFIGVSSWDGSPLKVLLLKDYPESALKLTNTLLRGVALGKNPRVIARQMAGDMEGNHVRALRIARTEMITSFRESGRRYMQGSGLIDEWEWLSEQDACPICLGKSGQRFPINQPMETHPNCRCAELPVITKEGIGD